MKGSGLRSCLSRYEMISMMWNKLAAEQYFSFHDKKFLSTMRQKKYNTLFYLNKIYCLL